MAPYTRPTMPLDLPALTLELLEYKMDDLRNRRPVRGGTDSLWDLRRELDEVRHRLDPEQVQRLDEINRELGRRESAPANEASSRLAPDFGDLLVGDERAEAPTAPGALAALDLDLDLGGGAGTGDDDAPLATEAQPLTPPQKAEQVALQRLARRVFGREIERFAEGVAAGWRAERERVTARLLYATMRNFERYRDTEALPRHRSLRPRREPALVHRPAADSAADGSVGVALRRRQPGGHRP